jgi:hypothetical protein
MTGLFNLISAVILLSSVLGVFGDPMEKCQPRNATYKIGDTEQCDKYYECNTGGKLVDRLCDDGFVFNPQYSHCNYPHYVNCQGREQLQISPSTNHQCPRMNGFYPFPSEISCQKFHHCLEGTAYEKTCPEGVIFDNKTAACVHPDLADREECSASAVLNFKCPNADTRFHKLKFGNHDRLAHTTDCRKFFICTLDGQPRIGGCPLGKVFNPKTGTCILAKHSTDPTCKDYYGKKSPPKLNDDDVEELQEEESNESAKPVEETEQDKENENEPKTKRPENHRFN